MTENAVLRDVMVRMRDGVHLATDVYLPAGKDRFPVILERTPYDKAGYSRSELDVGMTSPRHRADVAAYFTAAGYAVVYQDCRGRYRSEGVFTKYLSEGEDGYDTMAWLVRQPWCNGRIGTMGLSYAAHTQMALACLDAPGLACMVLDCGGFANSYTCGIRQGGAFELKQATWAFNQAKLSPQAKADPLVAAALAAEDLHAWFAAMPWKPGHSPVRHLPEYEDYLFEQWTHGRFDDFWKKLGIYAAGWYEAMTVVPTILLSGWYDAYVRCTLENYQALRPRHEAIKLVMGPWTHGDRVKPFAGDAAFGDTAVVDGQLADHWMGFRRRWFDRWLQDAENGAETDPEVRLFLMGGGSGRRDRAGRIEHGGAWIAGAAWPLPGTRPTPFYLHADGRLDRARPAAGQPPLAYDYDPDDPVPTIGGSVTSGEPIFSAGGFDQTEGPRFFGSRRPGLPLAARPDVLVFQTEPLAEDVAVAGPVTVQLWIASSCPDTDFTAKLVDVCPPTADDPRGFALNLTDGIIRCRYRDSWEHPSMLTPGRIYQVTIEPFATANLFKAGHRIRLDISSSNFPKYDVNPNTGEPEGAARRRQPAVNSVHVDAEHPSHVVLPLVPASALRPLRRS